MATLANHAAPGKAPQVLDGSIPPLGDEYTPRGRYDEEDDLYLDLGGDLAESPLLPFARLALTSALPDGVFDWEPGGDTLRVRWDHARTVERTLVRLWPAATVTAAAHPGYRGVRGGAR